MIDAHLAEAFDHIDHSHVLAQLGTFPAREQVAAGLRAGMIEKGRFAPTEEGTPQGGVVSPVLLNVALHGMEEAAGSGITKAVSPPGGPNRAVTWW